jgi:hypothetical protein
MAFYKSSSGEKNSGKLLTAAAMFTTVVNMAASVNTHKFT